MDITEAYEIVKSEFPATKFTSCTEYEKFYVFIQGENNLKPGIYVNKLDGSCGMFRPTMITPEDLNNSSKIMLEYK